MQKSLYQPPVAKLNNMMTKLGIIPIYKLIHSKTSGNIRTFVMRVTCPISRGGTPFSAEGASGHTKREAKHNAALTFMQAFLDCGNNKPSTTGQNNPNSLIDGVSICSEGLDMLQRICSKKDLGRPEIVDLCATSLSRTRTFTAECKVSDLRIAGRGNSKVEARLHATARMIQILMETASIHDILKSPSESQPPGKQALPVKTNGDETVSSRNNVNGLQIPGQDMMNGKRKMDARSPEQSDQKPRPCAYPDTTGALLEFLNFHEEAVKIEENNNSLEPNANLGDLTENAETKTSTVNPCTTSNNNDVLDCVKVEVDSTTSSEFHINLTRLQAVSQIERTLVSLEKQLYDKIIDAMTYSGLLHKQTVSILSHDYEVFIDRSSPPKILESSNECTDRGIKVACLTKLLLDLKVHIEMNHRKVIKLEPL